MNLVSQFSEPFESADFIRFSFLSKVFLLVLMYYICISHIFKP